MDIKYGYQTFGYIDIYLHIDGFGIRLKWKVINYKKICN